jgi:hypothetical protein
MKLLDRISAPKPEAQLQLEARAEANREALRNKSHVVTGELAKVATNGVVDKMDSLAIHHGEPVPTREVPVVDASAPAQEVPVDQGPVQK